MGSDGSTSAQAPINLRGDLVRLIYIVCELFIETEVHLSRVGQQGLWARAIQDQDQPR